MTILSIHTPPSRYKTTVQDWLERGLDHGAAMKEDPSLDALLLEFASSYRSLQQLQKEKPEVAKKYPEVLVRRCCLQMEGFPRSIPIGYVLSCFLLSYKPTSYMTEVVAEELRQFLWTKESGYAYRDMMFDHFTAKTYLVRKSFRPAVDPGKRRKLDGKEMAEILYGPANQKGLFD